ncbi:MAG: 4Fe-4S binding protein [Thermodesulfobacteriota bacterium]
MIKRQQLPRLRLISQTGFALFCLYSGWQFQQFYLWAMGQRATFVPRPAAVEAFLPISGLVGLKQLLITGIFDPIHPAALTIFMAALIIALLLRKGFCGWICPVGFTSNLAERLMRRLGIVWELPPWLHYPFLSLKYLLLAFFFFIIVIKMDSAALAAFNETPYNLVVDAKMLLFFLEPSSTTLTTLALLTLATLLIRNFWCRYLCPHGALLGLVALFGPLWIWRDNSLCVKCGRCQEKCPASLDVPEKKIIFSPECLGCGECLAACPVDKCLQLTLWQRCVLPVIILPLGVVGIFLLCYAVAVLTGHWQSQVPLSLLKEYYQQAAQLAHP